MVLRLIYFYNTGTAAITVDRVVVSGPFSIGSNNCEATTVAGVNPDGTGSGSYCYVYVYFTPTTTGALTGALTFTDSAPGSPHIVNLTGNGITATGTISLDSDRPRFHYATKWNDECGRKISSFLILAIRQLP